MAPASLSLSAAQTAAPLLRPAAVESLAGIVLAITAAVLLLVGPGHAWWRRAASRTPRLFASVAASTLGTTIIGLALTALDSFSLARLAALGAVIGAAGYLLPCRTAPGGPVIEAPGRNASVAVALLALLLYWPPYETHFAASDSTTYLAAGTYLADAGHVWKRDPLVRQVPALIRGSVFFSVMGQPWKPPYARMPGGLVMETPSSETVRPAFFPAPIVWSALFAGALGARYAGGFAPLFAALAVWAFWLVARRRLGAPAAALATALVALNAASYWAGRFPLAEPLAWFFLWAGLVAMDAFEDGGLPADAALAGALLAGAGLVRLELLPFVLVALLLRGLVERDAGARRLTPGFILCAAAVAVAALSQIPLLPGAYAAPLSDTFSGLLYRLHNVWVAAPLRVAACTLAAAAAAVFCIVRLGVARVVAAGTVLGFVVAYTVLASHASVLRSLAWLSDYLGPVTLVLGVAGAWIAWTERRRLPADTFLVTLAALVTCLLVYAPHVYPLMPWASRRFVPVVVPALILWAVLAATRLRARSSLAGPLVAAVLAVSVAWPAHRLWATPFYERSYDELETVAEKLPSDGTLLIDGRLIPLLLSTPLWLGLDRDNLPVDVSSVQGRRVTSALVHALSASGPVYLVKPSAAPAEPVPFVIPRRVSDFEIALLLPQQTSGPPPQTVDPYVQLVSVFELRPWKAPARK